MRIHEVEGAASAVFLTVRNPDMKPAFSVVPTVSDPAAKPESVADQVRRLQAEAANLARLQVMALEQALGEVMRLSNEIVAGGEAYPVGARELARRLAEDSEHHAKTLDAIISRQH
jgi:hypothetical protein